MKTKLKILFAITTVGLILSFVVTIRAFNTLNQIEQQTQIDSKSIIYINNILNHGDCLVYEKLSQDRYKNFIINYKKLKSSNPDIASDYGYMIDDFIQNLSEDTWQNLRDKLSFSLDKLQVSNQNLSSEFEFLSISANSTIMIALFVIFVLILFIVLVVLYIIKSKTITKSIIKEKIVPKEIIKQVIKIVPKDVTRTVYKEIEHNKCDTKSSKNIIKDIYEFSQKNSDVLSQIDSVGHFTDELSSKIKHTQKYTKELDELSQEIQSSSQKGLNLASQTSSSINDINKQTKSIDDTIIQIQKIAMQTNLLALNAAVEAANAGDKGRGFAVVAHEVRNLAGRSTQSSTKIRDLMEDIDTKIVKTQTTSSKMLSEFEQLNDKLDKSSQMSSKISSVCSTQKENLDSVDKHLNRFQNIFDDFSRSIDEAKDRCYDL
jgi:methyl-accepting chemotaxis protein